MNPQPAKGLTQAEEEAGPQQANPESPLQPEVSESLRHSVRDGTFYAMMMGFGEAYIVPFAVFLKANNIEIGLLSSLPQALGSLVQLFSHKLMMLIGSRKSMVTSFVLLQALMYVPITLVFFTGSMRAVHLIALVSLYWIFGQILMPAWNSWMGDLTKNVERGAYFGRRNRISGLSTFAAFLAAGYILQHTGGSERMQYAGFAAIFMLAMASRMISRMFLLKKTDADFDTNGPEGPGLTEFIGQLRQSNSGHLFMYLSLMNFAVYISVPFFTPYMLMDLKFDYITFTLVNAAAIIVKIISMPVWGWACDTFGGRKVLALSGYMMPVVPVLWVFSGDVSYILAIQAYSGLIWGAFEIASFSFILDTTTPQNRMSYTAYFNVINGMALLAGAMCGGLIVRYNELFWTKYYMVFIVSFLMRYAVSLFLVPRLREVRTVQSISYRNLIFKVITTMPTRGMVFSMIHFGRSRRAGSPGIPNDRRRPSAR